MEISYLDSILVAALIVAIPWLGVAMHRRTGARLAAGNAGARIEHYGNIIFLEWGMLLAVLALWGFSHRGWGRLGLGVPGGMGWWIGLGLGLLISALLVLQWRKVQGDDEQLRQMAGGFESLRALLPHDQREQRWFGAVSISAGICEEVVYRGFLLGVLAALGGMWVAVPVSSVIFGLAHVYQGPKGIAKTAAVGLVMAGLTVLTGSLWVAIIVHCVTDITSGLIAQRVANVSDQSPEAMGAPA